MGKKAFIAAIISIILALPTITVVNAQTNSTPSVPQFTLQIVGDSVQITIQNQPLIPNGHNYNGIFYSIRLKNHNATAWINMNKPSNVHRTYISEIGTTGSTMLQIPFLSINNLLGESYGDQIDFQIEAINGYLNTTITNQFSFDPNDTPVIIVNTSGWSETQTITMPTNTPLNTPTVPKFSANFVGFSYSWAASATIDPYTGENVTVPSHFTTNGTIQLSIANEPISLPFYTYLRFNVRMKGHFESNNWTDVENNPNSQAPGGIPPSDSDFTLVEIPAGNYPPNSQIDFQVEALVYNLTLVPYNSPDSNPTYSTEYVVAAESGWSATQTITILQSSPSKTPTSTPTLTSTATESPTYASPSPTQQPTTVPSTTPNAPSENLISIVVVVGAVITIVAVAGLLVYVSRRRRSTHFQHEALAVSFPNQGKKTLYGFQHRVSLVEGHPYEDYVS